MLVDDIRALERPVPDEPMLAALANAHNDALAAAVRVIEDAFAPMSGDLMGAVLPPEHPDHPVGQMLREYVGAG